MPGFYDRNLSLGVRLRNPGAQTVAPDALSGLALWLKSDTGVFSDAGTTPAVADGSIQQWNDQSGNNSHVLQGTAGSRPILKTSIINGFPSVRFTGASNHFLKSSAFGAAISPPFVMVMVYFMRVINGGTFVDGNATSQAMVDNPGTSAIRIQNTNSSVTSNTSVQTTSWSILTGGFFVGAGNPRIRYNGVNQVIAANNTVDAVNMTALTLGCRGSGGTNADVDFAEFMIYNRRLSTQEMIAVEHGLGTKYAISLG